MFFKTKLCILCLTAVVLTTFTACRTTSKEPTKDQEQYTNKKSSIQELPKRLISDYSDMQENEIVSWVWVKSGYTFDILRTAKVYPLENYCSVDYPWAEKKLEKALQDLFAPEETGRQEPAALGLKAAIVDMNVKPGIIKRFFPSIDDYPYVEIEIVMFEETSKKIVFTLCHFQKNEDFKNAVDGLINDLTIFFQEKT